MKPLILAAKIVVLGAISPIAATASTPQPPPSMASGRMWTTIAIATAITANARTGASTHSRASATTAATTPAATAAIAMTSARSMGSRTLPRSPAPGRRGLR